MTKAMTAMVAGLVLGVCVSAQAEYRTEVVVTPAMESHRFVVEFRIIDTDKDGKCVELQTPRITVSVGEEGQVKITNAKAATEVVCTALVQETNLGLEATTTVIIKDKGATFSFSQQSLAFLPSL